MTPRAAGSSPVISGLHAAARGRWFPDSLETHCISWCKSAGAEGAGDATSAFIHPAVMNVVIDGLYREYTILPATPERVWMAVGEHKRLNTL